MAGVVARPRTDEHGLDVRTGEELLGGEQAHARVERSDAVARRPAARGCHRGQLDAGAADGAPAVHRGDEPGADDPQADGFRASVHELPSTIVERSRTLPDAVACAAPGFGA